MRLQANLSSVPLRSPTGAPCLRNRTRPTCNWPCKMCHPLSNWPKRKLGIVRPRVRRCWPRAPSACQAKHYHPVRISDIVQSCTATSTWQHATPKLPRPMSSSGARGPMAMAMSMLPGHVQLLLGADVGGGLLHRVPSLPLLNCRLWDAQVLGVGAGSGDVAPASLQRPGYRKHVIY